MADATAPLPTLVSIRLLARAALRRTVDGRPGVTPRRAG